MPIQLGIQKNQKELGKQIRSSQIIQRLQNKRLNFEESQLDYKLRNHDDVLQQSMLYQNKKYDDEIKNKKYYDKLKNQSITTPYNERNNNRIYRVLKKLQQNQPKEEIETNQILKYIFRNSHKQIPKENKEFQEKVQSSDYGGKKLPKARSDQVFIKKIQEKYGHSFLQRIQFDQLLNYKKEFQAEGKFLKSWYNDRIAQNENRFSYLDKIMGLPNYIYKNPQIQQNEVFFKDIELPYLLEHNQNQINSKNKFLDLNKSIDQEQKLSKQCKNIGKMFNKTIKDKLNTILNSHKEFFN